MSTAEPGARDAAVHDASGADARRDATGGGTIVLLTEEPLHGSDLDRIVALHPVVAGGPVWAYWTLVPADTERNLLTESVDALGLGRLREAFSSAPEGSTDERAARAAADEVLATTLAALRERGLDADGSTTADDPLPAVRDAVMTMGCDEVVVVSRPRLVEDTLHRDWASRARAELGVPVLHLYGGTTAVG